MRQHLLRFSGVTLAAGLQSLAIFQIRQPLPSLLLGIEVNAYGRNAGATTAYVAPLQVRVINPALYPLVPAPPSFNVLSGVASIELSEYSFVLGGGNDSYRKLDNGFTINAGDIVEIQIASLNMPVGDTIGGITRLLFSDDFNDVDLNK